MSKILGLTAAAAIAFMASAVSADEMKGPITDIDMTNNTFHVGDKVFTASPENTVGVKLMDLQEGDNVRVQFANPESAGGKPINAMQLDKE
jgi:hypothetical protein